MGFFLLPKDKKESMESSHFSFRHMKKIFFSQTGTIWMKSGRDMFIQHKGYRCY